MFNLDDDLMRSQSIISDHISLRTGSSRGRVPEQGLSRSGFGTAPCKGAV